MIGINDPGLVGSFWTAFLYFAPWCCPKATWVLCWLITLHSQSSDHTAQASNSISPILLIGQEACCSMQDSKTLKIILIPKQYWTWFDWNGWTWRQAGVLERDRPIKLQDWREISYCWLRHVISIGIPLEILSVTWGLPQFCRFSDSDGRGWHSTFGGEVEQPGGRECN